jgi:hypothetical protein
MSEGEEDRVREYEGWLTPAEVLAQRPPTVPTSSFIRTVAASLEDGLIRAIAERLTLNADQHISFYELPIWVWRGWACLNDEDFWSLGTVTRYPQDHNSESGVRVFRAYRIRLERRAIEQIASSTVSAATFQVGLVNALLDYTPSHIATPLPAVKRDHRPKVDAETLKQWVAEFARRNPGVPFATIRDNARSAFPRFRIAERPVKVVIAELDLTLSAGNPRTLRN